VTETSNRPVDPRNDVDVLLRDTLRDDLSPAVEARLEGRIQRFVASRKDVPRRDGVTLPGFVRAPSPGVVAVAAGLLLAAGLGLQARAGPDGVAKSLSEVSAAAALARSVREATSMNCTGFEEGALASPAALADRVYRRWVLRGSRSRPDGAVVYEFLARDEPAVYELVSRDLSPPSEIRKRPLAPGSQPDVAQPDEVAVCSWEVPPAATPGLVFMLGR